MLAWYDDIKSLTTKSGEERNAFVRRHTRSYSNQSTKSVSSLEEDEADDIPYQASSSALGGNESIGSPAASASQEQRPQPGGRFPSDIQIRRDLLPRLSPSDGSEVDHDISIAAGGHQGKGTQRNEYFVQPDGIDTMAPRTNSLNASNGMTQSPTSVEMDATTPQSAINHDNESYAYVPGRVAAYETPLPIESSTPQPHTAEYVNSEPQARTVPPMKERHPNVLLASSQTKDFSTTPAKEKEVAAGLARKNTDNYHVPGEYPRGSVSA
jgi:hypothetical protein